MMETIIVEATEDSLDEVTDFWQEKLEALAVDPNTLFQIELSVEEVFVNIVSYAYEDAEESSLFGKVQVGCAVDEDTKELILQFTDAGKPFDPLEAKDADLSGKMFMERAGGFGIHMVKETMDEVTYARGDGVNILTLKKRL